MKKYIPAKMIRQSRFITYYETWGKDEKEHQVLENNGKTRESAEKIVADAI